MPIVSWSWVGLPAAALLAVLLVAMGLVLALLMRRRAGLKGAVLTHRRDTRSRTTFQASTSVSPWADFTDTAPVDGQAYRKSRHAEDDAEDVPPERDPRGAFLNSQQPAMDSWFHDLNTDFAPTEPLAPPTQTLAQPFADTTPMVPPERIQRALQPQADGPTAQAWATLRGYLPDAAHREATLQTCDRIAAAFEADGDVASARDVYEHMADIDPDWPNVRNRLMRVRGLAQASTVSTWGSVPPRPMPTPAQPGLGRYQIDKPLGQGSMGAVYQGHDPANGQRVALKTMALSREFSGDELADARNRFLREADMAGRLQHPDIVGILDAGETDGLAYIAMELVDGVDLSHHVQPASLLSPERVLRIVSRVADALAYAHTRGVTHRDIKPANIMVNMAHDVVKVMDFGVARVADASRTRTGVVLGTPTFMSPEQLSGQPIDGRSDLYSLGVTLFQLLTGALPYPNDSMAALMRAIGREPPLPLCSVRPDLPTELGDIVALALQKHPATRYASGQHMADDLRAVLRSMSN